MQMRHVFFIAGLGTLLCASTANAMPPVADTVFTNGFIYTVDAKNSVAQAVAIKNGKILYVGSSAEATRYISPHTQKIDLHGNMLMPGLVDGHMHPLRGGERLVLCSLQYLPLTKQEFSDRIKACLVDPAVPKRKNWLLVTSWFQEAMRPKDTILDKTILDKIDNKNPIVVYSSFGHSALLNTPALEAAHITASTKSEPGGEIIHDAKGQPTGLLEDTALNLIFAAQPAASDEQKVAAARAVLTVLRKQGVTSFLDARAAEVDIKAFSVLQQNGELTARAHFAPLITPEMGQDAKKSVDYVKGLSTRYDQGSITQQPTITVRHAKMYMDGVISAPGLTGILTLPYRINKGTAEHPDWQPGSSTGPAPYFPVPVLSKLLQGLVQAGIDPHMHADGDGAVRIALDAVEVTRKALPKSDFRPGLAHDELVAQADLPRFRQLGAIPVMSFQWGKRAPDTTGQTADALGEDRSNAMEPAYQLEKAGARIAYGSDWPVDPLNEWFALQVGITRQNAPDVEPQYRARLGDMPGLSRASVLRAITMNSAYELRQDSVTGSVEQGKIADLIILDRNITTIPVNEIGKTTVLMTMVGGKVVYSSGEFVPKTP
ncbi:amidohydrolase [Acetobacter senegalensis]|nr:amidohydrolase [Acetobacter senegalensis]MCG4266084.1 amidohydrolase [Acetobacter senegalensis]MPQ73070.1 amidohydrolase family protein [Acetobacter senegalensis]